MRKEIEICSAVQKFIYSVGLYRVHQWLYTVSVRLGRRWRVRLSVTLTLIISTEADYCYSLYLSFIPSQRINMKWTMSRKPTDKSIRGHHTNTRGGGGVLELHKLFILLPAWNPLFLSHSSIIFISLSLRKIYSVYKVGSQTTEKVCFHRSWDPFFNLFRSVFNIFWHFFLGSLFHLPPTSLKFSCKFIVWFIEVRPFGMS